MPLNYDTVKSTEKKEESSPMANSIKFRRLPDIVGPVVMGRVKNFTCPVCGEILKEAVTTNGKVQGWCTVKHQYIGG